MRRALPRVPRAPAGEAGARCTGTHSLPTEAGRGRAPDRGEEVARSLQARHPGPQLQPQAILGLIVSEAASSQILPCQAATMTGLSVAHPRAHYTFLLHMGNRLQQPLHQAGALKTV